MILIIFLILTFLITFSILLLYYFNLNVSNAQLFLKKKINFENIVKFFFFSFGIIFSILMFKKKSVIFAEVSSDQDNFVSELEKKLAALDGIEKILKNSSQKEKLIFEILKVNYLQHFFEEFLNSSKNELGTAKMLLELDAFVKNANMENSKEVQTKEKLKNYNITQLSKIFENEKYFFINYSTCLKEFEKRLLAKLQKEKK